LASRLGRHSDPDRHARVGRADDSRVEHRIHYAFLVLNTLRDLQLEERLLKSVFRDARLSDQSSELWSAGRGWVCTT